MRLPFAWIVLLALTGPLGPCDLAMAESPSTLPSGPGLAARYPGDAGIAEAPSVLLAEQFEAATLGQIGKRWQSVKNPDERGLELIEDSPAGSPGNRALRITARPGSDTGGHLYSRLIRGVDTAYARFYVKFPDDAGYIHHFVHLGGYNPATSWPQGGAGTRPQGDERVTVGIEPWGNYGRNLPPGNWGFYTYWHEMKISADGRYWGNGLRPIKPAVVPRNRWQCVEVMLKLNTPGRRDGELALWLDGKPAAHFHAGTPRGKWTGMGFRLLAEGGEPFEGFDWRTSDKLKVNFFWLLHYVTEEALRRNKVADPSVPNRVLFDNIVVATEYVGPLVKR